MIKSTQFFFSAFIFVIVSTVPARAGKITYSYDSNNRLIQAAFSGSSIGWEYDRNDNMLFSTAAKQFSWLLFLPAIIGQDTQPLEMTVSEDRESPVSEVTEQTGSEKERN
jgi:hypothetical protein